jgi:hypothetical protein
MPTAHVDLTESQVRAIRSLSRSNGKTEEDILREAVEQFLVRNTADDRLASLRKARGMWEDRQDLPNFAAIRAELDRQ